MDNATKDIIIDEFRETLKSIKRWTDAINMDITEENREDLYTLGYYALLRTKGLAESALFFDEQLPKKIV